VGGGGAGNARREDDVPVDEGWPTDGWPGAAYTREKAYVERLLDVFERRHPGIRSVRMRPAFVFKRKSASQQRRLFAGPFFPRSLAHPKLLPVVPMVRGLRFQVVHAEDAAEAFREALFNQVSGAFNLAAEPVLRARDAAELLGSRPVRLPAGAVRAGVALAWRTRVAPAPPGLFDAFMRLPVMDASRARDELGWDPAQAADWSALAVVGSTHQVRKQGDRLEVLRREASETQVEWGKYLLEQSALAAYGRVERAALNELNMQVPGAQQIVVVKP
jgi:cell division protein FtsL